MLLFVMIVIVSWQEPQVGHEHLHDDTARQKNSPTSCSLRSRHSQHDQAFVSVQLTVLGPVLKQAGKVYCTLIRIFSTISIFQTRLKCVLHSDFEHFQLFQYFRQGWNVHSTLI
jgi:hypothetical protein